MRANSLWGALSFAAVTALGLVPFLLVVGPIMGSGRALSAYVLASVAAHILCIAPSWARGLRLALVSLGLLLPIAFLTGSLSGRLLAAALVLSVVRSGLLYRARPARAIVLEALLLVGGLFLARLVWGHGLMSMALALWCFYLVQSLYFIAGGVRERRQERGRDEFAEARDRALSLMEEPTA